MYLRQAAARQNVHDNGRRYSRAAGLPFLKGALILGVAAVLSGCATFPPEQFGRSRAAEPTIDTDCERAVASTTLSVLTYNVEGLPWPARRNRSPQLREIGRQLQAMRANGQAPDVVLLQEVFTTEAGRIVESSGYSNYARGPGRGVRRPETSDLADPALTDRRKLFKGERLFRLFSSGLYLLSDFPIVDAAGQPFRRRECAGFDCLANKGLQYVRIDLPGVPQPIELFNTHLNSGRSARVSAERSLQAHNLQIEETARFIGQQREPSYPMIFGGDFNMRNNDERFARFSEVLPYPLVHQFCADERAACEVTLTWDGDEPWMDTQDLQGFDSGSDVTVRPIRLEGMFDEPWRGAPLADHDGLFAVYRLSWSADPADLALCLSADGLVPSQGNTVDGRVDNRPSAFSGPAEVPPTPG